MAVIIVPPSGTNVGDTTLNDTLQPDPSADLNGIPAIYELDGNSLLQSLNIGYAIEVDNYGTLTGTGTITGVTDASGGILPLLYNFSSLDVNGSIAVAYDNDGTTTVSQGERLSISGDMFSLGTVTVAIGGELDLDSPHAATLGNLDVEGALIAASPDVAVSYGSLTDNGTITVASGEFDAGSAVTGSGRFAVASGATLRFDTTSTAAATEAVSLLGGAALRLAHSGGYTGTLAIGGIGATIDLLDVAGGTATVANGVISVTSSSGTLSFNETGLGDGATIAASADPTGGTLLTIQTLMASSGGSGSGGSGSGGSGSGGSSGPGSGGSGSGGSGSGMGGTSSGGSTGTGSGGATPTYASIGVYRFFDIHNGTHFFTDDPSEYQNLLQTRPDLHYEGIGLESVNPANNDPNAAPVYRFFDTKYGTHFYSSDPTEVANVQATRSDLKFEGVGFYEHNGPQAGDVAVYRFFDMTYGTHFYSSDPAEIASIQATRPDLKPEGIAFYAPST